MIANLRDVLQPALAGHYAVAGLVVLGWEDALAYVEAAEVAASPVILQAGPNCRKHTPLAILATMFRHLAEHARVPVVSHLDHASSLDECREAIDLGFTSVMYDGSRLPLHENIERTRAVVELAHPAGVSVEGEVGIVGYAGGEASIPTRPDEAAAFERETGVDAIAVAIGNTHLQLNAASEIDMDGVRAIEAVTVTPLVVHGGSGLSAVARRDVALHSRVCKINFGTELRRTFGMALRAHMAADPAAFDRIALLAPTIPKVRDAALEILTQLR
ncbi:MAG TPA: class II fructose-bisphosphate aldolase [Bauldia sp.]|nr:class II fructose-bisphosphate aldolase [Bauldia sp.]